MYTHGAFLGPFLLSVIGSCVEHGRGELSCALAPGPFPPTKNTKIIRSRGRGGHGEVRLVAMHTAPIFVQIQGWTHHFVSHVFVGGGHDQTHVNHEIPGPRWPRSSIARSASSRLASRIVLRLNLRLKTLFHKFCVFAHPLYGRMLHLSTGRGSMCLTPVRHYV